MTLREKDGVAAREAATAAEMHFRSRKIDQENRSVIMKL
jgi:hypothetical protein